MAAPAYQQHYYTYAEYLALEEEATERHEYYQGDIIEMSGGTAAHTEVAANIARVLGTALRPHPCHVYGSDLRVKVEAVNYSSYADVMVICGEPQYYQNRTDVVTNPLLIVEVLSPSTRSFDQTTKYKRYRKLPSFEHYLTVEPDQPYVGYHQKIGFFWQESYYEELNQTILLPLPHGEVALPLTLIYEKIVFPAPPVL